MKYHSGDFYSGEWQSDSRHGKGKLIFSNSEVYQGDFCDGQISGYGKQTYLHGGYYKGYWLNNMKHGLGKHKNE